MEEIQPTDKKFEVEFCTIAHWKDGEIIEEKLFYDLVGLMRQISLCKLRFFLLKYRISQVIYYMKMSSNVPVLLMTKSNALGNRSSHLREAISSPSACMRNDEQATEQLISATLHFFFIKLT